MSIVKKLGEGYRFTERDFNLGWELLVKLDSTDEEEEFSYLALLAEEMQFCRPGLPEEAVPRV